MLECVNATIILLIIALSHFIIYAFLMGQHQHLNVSLFIKIVQVPEFITENEY